MGGSFIELAAISCFLLTEEVDDLAEFNNFETNHQNKIRNRFKNKLVKKLSDELTSDRRVFSTFYVTRTTETIKNKNNYCYESLNGF